MIRSTIGYMLLIILALQLSHASAQESPVSETAQNQVLVNDVLATVGQEVTLHMRFETQTDVKVSLVSAEITFPVPQLSFVRVERPYPMEKVKGEISVQEIEPGRLQVEVGVPEDSSEALPEEAIAFLVMQIAANVEALPLPIVVETAQMRDLEGRTLKDLQGSQAQINVVSEELYPLVSCFFYMH